MDQKKEVIVFTPTGSDLNHMDQKVKRSQRQIRKTAIANRMDRLDSDDLQIDREKERERREKLSCI